MGLFERRSTSGCQILRSQSRCGHRKSMDHGDCLVAHGTNTNLLKGKYLPRARTRRSVRGKEPLLRPAAHTQSMVKEVLITRVQLVQRVAETNSLIMTCLASNMFLETAYTHKNAEKLASKKAHYSRQVHVFMQKLKA